MLSKGLIMAFHSTEGVFGFGLVLYLCVSTYSCSCCSVLLEHMASASGDDHASTIVPPQFEEIRPNGILYWS